MLDAEFILFSILEAADVRVLHVQVLGVQCHVPFLFGFGSIAFGGGGLLLERVDEELVVGDRVCCIFH